jgi:hypothetical protein
MCDYEGDCWGLVPHRVGMVGGAQHIRQENPHLLGKSFGLSKANGPYMLSAPMDLGPGTCGSEGSW